MEREQTWEELEMIPKIIEHEGKKYRVIEIVEPSKTIIFDGWEIEKKIHHKGKTYAECEEDCPEGWEIPTYFLLQELRNSEKAEELNLIVTWEFVQNPDEIAKNKGFVAGFSANSDGAGLYCYWVPSFSDSSLGVRYARRIKEQR